jgi:hypothetical protein
MSERSAQQRQPATTPSRVAVQPMATAIELIKQIYNSLFGVFFLLSLISSVGLFISAANTSGTVQTFWLGVGTSLLASTVFSSLQVLVTNRANERLLLASVGQAAQDVADSVLERNRRYVPLAVYDETKTFNPAFNRDLTADLCNTTKYVFNGLTGRYVGARLLSINRRINEILVIIGDPSSDDAVRVRIEHRGADPDFDREGVREQLRRHADLCVIGLFRSRRQHGPIELILTRTPMLDRVEICDHAGYLTLFSAREDRHSVFPQTLRWSPESPMYVTTHREAKRTAESPSNVRLRITPTMGEDELLTFYRDKLGRDLDRDGLEELQERFRQFELEFSTRVTGL